MRFAFRYSSWATRLLTGLRYRVKVKGDIKEVRRLARRKGILFLPNHPALIDPVLVMAHLGRWLSVHPVMVEQNYYIPGIYGFLKRVAKALPIPNFQYASNSYKVMRAERTLDRVVDGLQQGKHYVIYPSGRLRRTPLERLGGASAVFGMIQRVPEAPLVLVRTTGLWGSRFGWGLTGQSPSLGEGMATGLKVILKNLILFTPRRKVTIEVMPAPPELRCQESRPDFNEFLERWYNAPFPDKGEPLTLVSYSRWHANFPLVTYTSVFQDAKVTNIPLVIRKQVMREVARLSHRRPSDIRLEMHLFTDLGLDSLDIADLVSSLEVENAPGLANFDLMSVGALMALVAGRMKQVEVGPPPKPSQAWKEEERPSPCEPEGTTLTESWLRCVDRMGKRIACVDQTGQVMRYTDLKRRIVGLARKIEKLPEERIGVMLPSSALAQITVLAVMMAGKIPVMVNWTLGPRYLESVKVQAQVATVLTAYAFIDVLDGADFTPIHDQIVLLEGVRRKISRYDQLATLYWSRCSTEKILKRFKGGGAPEEDTAVLLFTSGTEAAPKAVPLTHRNLLSNQRVAARLVDFQATDVAFSMLPPFHSLGFSITGLLPLLTGTRAVYFPNPTSSRAMATEIERYQATVICSAPTFLKALFRVAHGRQLRSLRLLISGAEKAPQELFEQVENLEGGATLIEGYGITECSPILTLNRKEEAPAGVGRAIDGVDIIIVDPETHKLLPEGERGLILAHGPNVFSGYLYYDGPSPFVELEGERWFETGDLGSLDQDGALILAGRLKRFVKIGGEMISLPAVEEALLEVAHELGWGGMADKDLAVIAVEQENQKPTLILFATFFVEEEEVNRALKGAGFSNLVRIGLCRQLNEMPLMGTGKTDYRSLQGLANQEGAERGKGQEEKSVANDDASR